jgi:katanin p60 ATPase-containing subunit A1
MNISVADICENTKMGREFALLGNYETALVYYQGVVQQIHRLLQSVNDPMRKERWQEVRRLILSDYGDLCHLLMSRLSIRSNKKSLRNTST